MRAALESIKHELVTMKLGDRLRIISRRTEHLERCLSTSTKNKEVEEDPRQEMTITISNVLDCGTRYFFESK